MKKIIIVLMLIFILGCNTNNSINPSSKKGIIEEFRSGTEGLVVEKITGAPPDKILENEEFNFGIEITNKAPTDIKGAKIFLGGLESNYFTYDQTIHDQEFDFEGRSQFNPEGEKKIIEIEAKNIGLPQGLTKDYVAPYEIGIEYQHDAITNAEICVDIKNNNLANICRGNKVNPKSQGSPVAPTSIEYTTTSLRNSKKVNFEITIEKVGSGEVNGNIVTINSVKLAEDEVECKQDKIELKKGKASLFCSIDISNTKASYNTILITSLTYNYRYFSPGELTIKRTNQ